MQKIISTAVASIIFTTSIVGSVVPASAQRYDKRDRERYVERYCDRNPRDRDCRDFRSNHNRWDETRYKRWYRDRYRNDDNAAAAIFGLAAGAIVGGALGAAASGNSGWTAHVQACEAQYRSYDRASDTFLGYDGLRHRCTAL